MTTQTKTRSPSELTVHLRTPHAAQRAFIESRAKRKCIRAGRRSGKTVGIAQLAVQKFLAGRRVLYAVPTTDQMTRFWFEVKRALAEPLDAGVLYKNETDHIIEVPDTLQRIRAKTAWNADTLRGDYADDLLLDEYQLMSEDAWELVGAPMLLDTDGDAVFAYTPPSIHSRSTSKATDKLHAAKLFKRAKADMTGRWATFHFTSYDNPHLSRTALARITGDMTSLAIAQEIMAEDREDAPGALWTRAELELHRVSRHPELVRVVVGIDPSTTSAASSAEAGIIVGGLGADGHGYLLADPSLKGSPHEWARAAVTAYNVHKADRLVAEVNNGGDMVEVTIRTLRDASDSPIGRNVAYKSLHASRGKQTRAEPVAALYEQGRIHHVGTFAELEDQLCQWTPGDTSPDRLDANAWVWTELMLSDSGEVLRGASPLKGYRG